MVAFGTTKPSAYAAKGPADLKAKANKFKVRIGILNNDINVARMQILMLLSLVYLINLSSSTSGFMNLWYISLINIVDAHNRFESALDIVAATIEADTTPVMMPGA